MKLLIYKELHLSRIVLISLFLSFNIFFEANGRPPPRKASWYGPDYSSPYYDRNVRRIPDESLENNLNSLTISEFVYRFSKLNSELTEFKTFSILREFFDLNSKTISPDNFLQLLTHAKNPEQQEWLVKIALKKSLVEWDGALVSETNLPLRTLVQIALAIREPGVRKRLAFLFNGPRRIEIKSEGTYGTQTFRVGDSIRAAHDKPLQKLAGVFPDGSGMTVDGELIGPLASFENLSSVNRSFDERIKDAIGTLWEPLKTLLKLGHNQKADILSNQMYQLTLPTTSIASKKLIAENIVRNFPELPIRFRRRLASLTDVELPMPRSPRGSFYNLFYKRDIADLSQFALSKVLPAVREYFGTRLASLPGPRASALRKLLGRLSPDVDVSLGPRTLYDRSAKELISNYPELSPKVKESLLELIIDPTEAELETAKRPPVFGPDSLIDNAETIELRSSALKLADAIIPIDESGPKPKNDRRVFLDNFIQRLRDPMNFLTDSSLLQAATQSTLRHAALNLLTDYADLPPTTKQIALSMLKDPTEQQIQDAQKIGPPDPINPIEFTAKMLEWEHRVANEINPLFDRLRETIPVSRTEKVKELLSVMGKVLLGDPQGYYSTLAIDLSKLPIIERYSVLSEKIIREHPDLPTKFRQILLDFIEHPSADLISMANAAPKMTDLSSDNRSVTSPQSGLKLTPKLLSELGPNGLLENKFFLYPINMWKNRNLKGTPLPVVWLGSSHSELTHFVTPAAHVAGSWNPRSSLDIFEVLTDALDLSYFGSAWNEVTLHQRRSPSTIIPKASKRMGTYPYPIEIRNEAIKNPENAESLRINFALEQIPKSCVQTLGSIAQK